MLRTNALAAALTRGSGLRGPPHSEADELFQRLEDICDLLEMSANCLLISLPVIFFQE